MFDKLMNSDWTPFGLGMTLVAISALILGFYIHRIRVWGGVSSDERILVLPMYFTGAFGSVLSVLGLAIRYEKTYLPFWAMMTDFFFLIWFITIIYWGYKVTEN